MDQTIAVLPSKHLACDCITCHIPNAPYKVEYLYGNLVVMSAMCAKCHLGYWVRWDLLKVQMDQDEREVQEIQDAMKLLGDAA